MATRLPMSACASGCAPAATTTAAASFPHCWLRVRAGESSSAPRKLERDQTGHVLEVVGEGGVGRELAGDAAPAALQRGDAVAPEPRSEPELPQVRRIDRRGLDLADEVLLARDGGRGDLLHAVAQGLALAPVDERAHGGRRLGEVLLDERNERRLPVFRLVGLLYLFIVDPDLPGPLGERKGFHGQKLRHERLFLRGVHPLPSNSGALCRRY